MTSNVITQRTWSPRANPVPAAAVLIAVAIVGVGVTIAALVTLNDAPRGHVAEIATTLAYVVPYAVVGAFLVVRRPDLPFGWLLSGCAAAVAVGVAVASQSYAALSQGADSPVLKYGVSARHRAVPAGGRAGSGERPVPQRPGALTVRPGPEPTARRGDRPRSDRWDSSATSRSSWIVPTGLTDTLHNPLTGGTVVGEVASAFSVAVPLVILLGIIAETLNRPPGLEGHRHRARPAPVAGLRCRALARPVPLIAVTEELPLAVSLVDGLLFTTTLVIPIVRYRLWAIDTIIRRSATYVLVSVVVTGVFAALAAGVAALQGERVGLVAAAVITALVFGPALRRSQHVVDELFYGRRSDPYQALRDLSRRLDAIAAPSEVLKTVVTAVAESLRLPYVAIERPGDGSVLAQHGDLKASDAELGRWPLVSQGTRVGTLVAAPRRAELMLDPRDGAVLADLARQAGAAVHTEALTADLAASRQRIVEAREEERRRLRR